jgi:hypothetical protein
VQLDIATSAASPTPSPSATSTPSVSPSVPQLKIIDANYAGQNVSDKARTTFVQQDGSLFINLTAFNLPVGSPDPWYGTRKCLSVLHSYNSSIRTFVACDSSGFLKLVPGDITLSPLTQEITRQGPTTAGFAIVSVVWGAAEIRDAAVYQRIFDGRTNKTPLNFTNALFGKDTLPDEHKSGVIWYTQDNFTTFNGVFARESTAVQF